MKNNILWIFIGAVIMVSSAFVACKSTPTAPSTSAEPKAVSATVSATNAEVKPADDSLTALRDQMENLRNECLKYKLDALKIMEWEGAEQSRKVGLEALDTDQGLARQSFETAIGKYEDIKKNGLKDLTDDLDSPVLSAREAAVKVSANEFYPLQFALADTTAEQFRTLRQAGDLTGAYDISQLAIMRYRTLEKERTALIIKQKIDFNEFGQFAPAEYMLAADRYEEALAVYGTADAAAIEASGESVALFELVSNVGFKNLSVNARAKATEIRSLCDSVKADKAAKTEYRSAASVYDAAEAHAKVDSWEPAYEAWSQSSAAFASVYQLTVLKRNAADIALDSAMSRQAASAELARAADAKFPLAEDAEGFADDPVSVEPSVSGEESK